jgi:hypothetical protein
MQIQSLSQSSLEEHAAPRQCPGHVHVAYDVVVGQGKVVVPCEGRVAGWVIVAMAHRVRC